MQKSWIVALIVVELSQSIGGLSQTPVIGIFAMEAHTQESTDSVGQTNVSYFAASYVKYLEMAGAQVVPVLGYQEKAYYDNLLPKINGVLFTGGAYNINITNRWTQNADYILKYSIAQYDKGSIFPIWGTCLGHQLLMYLTAGYDHSCISSVTGQNATTNTLKPLPGNHLYANMSDDLLYKLQNGQGLVYFNHHYAIRTSYFNRSSSLQKFWKIQSTTVSPGREEFVSSAQAQKYPVFSTQYHPEKTLFQWKVFALRSEAAVDVTQTLANQFVDMARKSPNRFNSPAEFEKINIYNYKTHTTNTSFTRIYIFNEETKREPWKIPNLRLQ